MINFIKKLLRTKTGIDNGAGITESGRFKNIESRRSFMTKASAGIITAPFVVDSLINQATKTGSIDVELAKKQIKKIPFNERTIHRFSEMCPNATLTADYSTKCVPSEYFVTFENGMTMDGTGRIIHHNKLH